MSTIDRVGEYFEHLQRQLSVVLDEERDAMLEAARTWAQAIANDRLIYVFGSGHSRFIAGEMYWRAGGLAAALTIDDPSLGEAERVEGYAKTVIDQYDLGQGDVLIVISNSGINPLPVEMALHGKERGATVLALTSLAHSRASESRHSSGRRLFEIADQVLDTHGEYGDAVVPVTGRDYKTAPTSTAVSVAILNAVVAQTAEILAQQGIEPPVLVSKNTTGGDEHNERLVEKYGRRLARFPQRKG